MRVIPVKMIRQLSFILLLLALCALFWGTQSHSVDNDDSKDVEIVKVGVRFFPPWISTEDGVVKGYDYDFLCTLFKHLDVKAEFIPMEFSKILKGLETGDIDISTGMLFREERNKYIRFISPPYRTKSTFCFYARKETGVSVSKYIDLAGMRIGVSDRVRYFPTFDLDDRMQKVPYPSLSGSFKGLLAGEVDVVICSGAAGAYYVEELGISDRVDLCEFIYAPKLIPIYVGVSRKSPLATRVNEISAVLYSLQKSGILYELATKYSVVIN